MEKVPTERIILLLLAAMVITILIVWVLVRIAKEMMRQFDLWVLQRARYLENHHHHQQHHNNKVIMGAQKRKLNKKGKDNVYSGESQSSSGSGSESD